MYSNCLFEAIKAKLKDPKNVHIHYLSKKLNPTNHLHFYWYNLAENENYGMYDFSHINKLKQRLWFNGEINSIEIDMWESFIYRKMSKLGFSEKDQINYAKKHKFVNKKPFKYSRI